MGAELLSHFIAPRAAKYHANYMLFYEYLNYINVLIILNDTQINICSHRVVVVVVKK